jgi:FtsP/CotA-like multicopper oxidase with cupredoxin domain
VLLDRCLRPERRPGPAALCRRPGLARRALIFDENTEGGGHGGGAAPAGEPTEEEIEGNLKHAINGLIFGNLRGLEMNKGDRGRWYALGLGDEADLHTPHWHGETLLLDGRSRTDVIELLPSSMHVADLVTDNPGTWLFHCHIADHIEAGMDTTFEVR